MDDFTNLIKLLVLVLLNELQMNDRMLSFMANTIFIAILQQYSQQHAWHLLELKHSLIQSDMTLKVILRWNITK